MTVKQLTQSQRATFFTMVAAAALSLGEEREEYRKRIMREELGAEHLAEVSRTTGFDKLMARAAVDAGDYIAAARYCSGTLARVHRLIGECAAKVCEARGLPVAPWKYVAGVLVQAKMLPAATCAAIERLARPEGWTSFTEVQAKKVLVMLTAQLQRERRGR